MREAASHGFWMSTYAPYGYKKTSGQNGAKKRPRLDLDPPADSVVRRIFDMALRGSSPLDITKALNREGIASRNGKRWLKTVMYRLLTNESYTGTLVWGATAKDGAPPVRVENAFPPSSLRRSSAESPARCGPVRRRRCIPGVLQVPTCSAVWSSARPVGRPSRPRKPRVAGTPTTSVTLC